MFLCRSQAFLRAQSMFASIKSSQLPSCSYDTALALLSKRCVTRDGRNLFATSLPIFCKICFSGMPDTRCRRSPFALKFSEVISFPDGVTSTVLGDKFVRAQVPGFLASKFHVRFNKLYATSELLIRQGARTSTALSALLSDSQGCTFSSRALSQIVL